MAGMKRQFAKRTTLTESRYLVLSHQGKLLVHFTRNGMFQTSIWFPQKAERAVAAAETVSSLCLIVTKEDIIVLYPPLCFDNESTHHHTLFL